MMRAPIESAVIIVGGGPAGIAVAAYLRHVSIPYILLEREDCIASLWQKYTYDRVHLHLAKQFCHLPLMPFPSTYPTFVSREDFLRYLNDYVSRFDVTPTFRRSVEAAEYDETVGKWKIKARNLNSDEIEEFSSRFLVVATGESCDPSIPEIQGMESFAGEILHSTKYKNGHRFSGRSVLVVGSGNSGMEIALDLANSGAITSIVVRSPVKNIFALKRCDYMEYNVSRRTTYAGMVLRKYLSKYWIEWMLILMSKIMFGDVSKYGIRRPKEGPVTMLQKYGKYPVVDIGTMAKISSREIQLYRLEIAIEICREGFAHRFPSEIA